MAHNKTPEQLIQEQTLLAIRNEIDAIDRQLQDLINQRATCAEKVAEIKQRDGAQEQVVFYRPDREAQVLRTVMERNQGPLRDKEIARLFREVMSACLAHEKPLQVAYLGPKGTFTQTASLKHFGHSAQCFPMATIEEVFRDVEAFGTNYGVVPVENSTEGMVNHTLDRFRSSSLSICGEVELRVHQNLLVKPGTKLHEIEKIFSHQQSLGQCHTWLTTHLNQVQRMTVNSNAEAARLVAESPASGAKFAAIAGTAAAEEYELEVAYANIEDQPDNSTRFLVVGHEAVPATDHDKTSLMVWAKHRSGTLYHLLAPFQYYGINMTSIESRPSGIQAAGPVFYIDFEGHQEDALVQELLQDLESQVTGIRILGSYPQAVV